MTGVQTCALPILELLVIVEAIEDFLLCFVADGAGVVEDETGFFLGFDLTIALALEGPDDFFRVMGVHLTAEGLKIEGFFRRHHKVKYILAGDWCEWEIGYGD